MARIVITGMGHYHPENVLDNQLFDALDIGSSGEWIEERTGIKERRSVLTPEQVMALRHGRTTIGALRGERKFMGLPDMAAGAWPIAAERAGLAARGVAVGTVIGGTSTPELDAPANACAFSAKLGLSCAAFDVNSACSSFVVGLHVGRHLSPSVGPKAIGLINADCLTTRVDYTDRATSILFGDACTAAVIESDPTCGGLEVLDTLVVSDPERYPAVTIPDGAYFAQDGRVVQKFAITKTVEVTTTLLARHGLRPADLAYFIGHQANVTMLESTTRMLGLPPEKHLHNAALYGNQGSAGAPAVLSTHWGRFRPGDLIALSVVGAGLTWSSVLLRRC